MTWTGRAAEYLGKREYRYLSPVFVHSPDGTVRSIVRAALTNNPNLQQLTALASAETPPMDPNATPSSPDALLTEIRKALGLPDTASDAEILAKLRDLTTSQQAATPDPTQFVPIGASNRRSPKCTASIRASRHRRRCLMSSFRSATATCRRP